MPSRQELANAIRVLSMDAVQKAKSGHPGAPMGMADIAEVLWRDFLKHNPTDPNWADRDRFILSNGHGSMLIYSLLHLSGYDLPIDEIKNFRQLHSKTPGHPEYGYTPGVETTTGPLGAGISNAVGMAIAEKTLAAQFNREGHDIVDHFTYCFLGDGCLMEGISHEACSLAGTLGLGKLVAFWDDNGISIDGKVTSWFSDNTPQRFEAYNWHVLKDVDGHDPEAIATAIIAAQAVTDKPTLICCKTTIGFGSPSKSGSETAHGSPLGEAEIAATKAALGWEHDAFVIPDAISGLMMPSVDSAGRCYPFVVICQLKPQINIFTLASKLDSFHAHCEDFIIGLLEQQRPDLDDITQLLQRHYEKFKCHRLPDIKNNISTNSADIYRTLNPNLLSFSDVHEAFLSHILAQQSVPISIWHTAQNLQVKQQYRYYQGMPPVEAFVTLLKGE